jgi:hypothetical protein
MQHAPAVLLWLRAMYLPMSVDGVLKTGLYSPMLNYLLYIYKSESGWLAGRVCVYVARQRGHFLWGRTAAQQ